MDDPPLMPEFEAKKMMDLEVVDPESIMQGYEELISETEDIFNSLLDMDQAVQNNVQPTEAIQDVLSEDLEFFEKLNNDYHQFKQSLLPNQQPTSAGFISFLKSEMEWKAEEIEYVQQLADELDGHDGIGFITDIEYAQQLSTLLDAFMKALEDGDPTAEIRAEDAARTLYLE